MMRVVMMILTMSLQGAAPQMVASRMGGGGEGGMEEGEVQQVRGRVRPRTHGTVLRPSPAANGKHHGGTASSSLGTMAYQGLMRVFSWGSLWGGAPRGR